MSTRDSLSFNNGGCDASSAQLRGVWIRGSQERKAESDVENHAAERGILQNAAKTGREWLEVEKRMQGMRKVLRTPHPVC